MCAAMIVRRREGMLKVAASQVYVVRLDATQHSFVLRAKIEL